METKFNFNSAICTSKEQSRRLLALGLKKETADMVYRTFGYVINGEVKERVYEIPQIYDSRWEREHDIPAWSLHRLIEMMPNEIHKYDSWASLSVNKDYVQYEYYDIDYNHGTCLEHFNDGNIYDNICDAYEWLINEGYFNKEYLCKR